MNYFNYFSEIEETFVRRRGKHLFLSPLDWALMEAWQDRGIPLHVVLRSIESVFDVFDRQPLGTRTIKSLFYCREEVESQFSEWSRSQAGKAEPNGQTVTPFDTDAVAAHIRSGIDQLGCVSVAGMKEDLDRAILRLGELLIGVPDEASTIDGTLSDVEEMLVRSMLSNWEKTHLKEIEREIAGLLREYKSGMTTEAYESTFRLMLVKRLREESGIPRLGLYYL